MKILVLLLIATVIFLPVQCISDSSSSEWEGVAWLLRIYGYEMDPSIVSHSEYHVNPSMFDCGDVQIEIREVIYDGVWMYTSITAIPTHPKETILIPSSAALDDYIAGGYHEENRNDPRTFLQAAQDNGKDFVYINAYPIEFDKSEYRFSDHRQDAGNQTTLFSGAPLVLHEDESEIHFYIEIIRFSASTGREISSDSYKIPVKVFKLSSKKKVYATSDENAPFKTITLLQTPLATYAYPDWIGESFSSEVEYTLLNENGTQYPSGIPEDTTTYRFDKLPCSIFVHYKSHQKEYTILFSELNE